MFPSHDRGESKAHGVGNWLIKATVPKTNIKIGEQLNLLINIRMASSLNTFTNYIGNDPANRSSGDFEFTKSTLYIPARIDL